jgi:hypothetical protein
MPRLSQWLARTALLYLLLGFTVGALLLAHKGVPFYPNLWRWLPAHMEFLLIGWTVQLTMGVAFWILPRYWQPPQRPQAAFAWPAYALLNLGIWLVVAGTTLGLGRWLLLAGRLVESAAVLFFALSFWRRIVSREGTG